MPWPKHNMGQLPDIAGKNIANPISLILSTGMLIELDWRKKKLKKLNLASSFIDKAVIKILSKPTYLTRDLGGNSSTKELTKNFINVLKKTII
jgi:3-isopropylmalate dehydrogenase